MTGLSPDPFVLEIRELARLIALAREWVLRGPPDRPAAARGEIRARRLEERPAGRFGREAAVSAAVAADPAR